MDIFNVLKGTKMLRRMIGISNEVRVPPVRERPVEVPPARGRPIEMSLGDEPLVEEPLDEVTTVNSQVDSEVDSTNHVDETIKQQESNLAKYKKTLAKLKKVKNQSRDKLNKSNDVIKKVLADLEDMLTCPITCEIMNDPVITPYGQTYSRKAIEEYIKIPDNDDPL